MIDRRGFKGLVNTKQQQQIEEAYRKAGPDGSRVVQIIREQLNRADERNENLIKLLRELEKRAMKGENVFLEYPEFRRLDIRDLPWSRPYPIVPIATIDGNAI